MKNYLMTMVACFALIQSAEAALPPLYQGSNEIKSILNSEELGKKLQSGELILRIEKTPQGYEIVTNHHHMQVDVIYEPSKLMGPIPYHLKFQDPLPLSPH